MTLESQTESRALLVGLGNPGRQYRHNRHNIGFMLMDLLAEKYTISLNRVQNKAIVGSGQIANRPVILVKPQTYMNLSGTAVSALLKFYKIAPTDLLVSYDELDLPSGTLRLRAEGGPAGHNGMRSIIEQLGPNFPRLRLGIGRPAGQMAPAAYVLQDFDRAEQATVARLLAEGIKAVETFLESGIVLAMSKHNGNYGEG